MQRLPATTPWNADAAWNELRNYIVEHLGDDDAVLEVNAAPFLKRVMHTPSERNCAIGELSGSAGPGHGLLSRMTCWTSRVPGPTITRSR